MTLRTLCFATAILALAASAARAEPITLGDLAIDGMWTRATAPRAPNGGAFLTIRNAGAQDDRLVSVSTPAAARAELHSHTMADGMMRMRPVEGGIAVPAGGSAELQPGGLHVMMMGLKAPLVQGTSIPVTLTFEKAGTATIDVPVLAAGANAAPGHHHDQNDGDGDGKMPDDRMHRGDRMPHKP